MKMYILVDKVPIITNDINEWGKGNASNSLSKTIFNVYGEDVEVSTVFLGFDHNHNGGKAILFETMVFGGEFDLHQERYYTYDEAMIGHQLICDMVDKVGRNRDEKLRDLGI